MANSVIVRLDCFIRDAWVNFSNDTSTGTIVDFRGDNRGFTPDTGTGGAYERRFRTAQEFHVDFVNRTITAYANTGQTCQRNTYTVDGSTQYYYAYAPTTGLNYSNVLWGQSSVQFDATNSTADPLVPGAPSIDYNFHISVWQSGTVAVKGTYDGFPDLEIYKKIDGGQWYTVYQFNADAAGNSLADLAPGLGDFTVNAQV